VSRHRTVRLCLKQADNRRDMESRVKGTILIVEDEPAIRRLHARSLIDSGYECVETETVNEALAVFQQRPIDVAVLDVRTPSGSGLVLAHQIHEYYKSTVVIVATDVADFSTATEAMRAGAVDYLVKPIPADTLSKSVARAMARKRAFAPTSPAAAAPVSVAPAAAQATATKRADGKEPAIDALFRAMCATGASDLHLSVGMPPMVRKDGHMKPLEADSRVLEPATVIQLLHEIVPGKNREEFEERHDSDFAYELEGVARFRGNIFMDRKGMGAVFR